MSKPSPQLRIDKVNALFRYYPKSVRKYDFWSNQILNLKNENPLAIDRFRDLILPLLESMEEPLVICTIPSSDPTNTRTGMFRLARELRKSKSNLVDGLHCIVRSQAIEKLATGGKRKKEIHLDSIEIHQTNMLKNKSVLLIDDICSTGNSYKAIKELLINAGVAQVFFIALGGTYRSQRVYSKHVSFQYHYNNLDIPTDIKNNMYQKELQSLEEEIDKWGFQKAFMEAEKSSYDFLVRSRRSYYSIIPDKNASPEVKHKYEQKRLANKANSEQDQVRIRLQALKVDKLEYNLYLKEQILKDHFGFDDIEEQCKNFNQKRSERLRNARLIAERQEKERIENLQKEKERLEEKTLEEARQEKIKQDKLKEERLKSYYNKRDITYKKEVAEKGKQYKERLIEQRKEEKRLKLLNTIFIVIIIGLIVAFFIWLFFFANSESQGGVIYFIFFVAMIAFIDWCRS